MTKIASKAPNLQNTTSKFTAAERRVVAKAHKDVAAAKAATIVSLDRRPAERAEHFAARVDASKGKLPVEPDFSADTHRAYRKRLAAITAMIKARDVKGLQADETQPVSSSRVILCRYRDNAIAALQAKAAKAPAKAAKAAKAAPKARKAA
jgi:hypothetical protein